MLRCIGMPRRYFKPHESRAGNTVRGLTTFGPETRRPLPSYSFRDTKKDLRPKPQVLVRHLIDYASF